MKNTILGWKKDHPVGVWVVVGVVIFLILISTLIVRSMDEKIKVQSQNLEVSPSQTTPQNVDTKKHVPEPDKRSEGTPLSWWAKTFVLILLVGVFIALIYQDYTGEGTTWTQGVKKPLSITLIAILVLNLLSALAIPEYWLLFWNEHLFFFIMNISIVLAVHFWAYNNTAGHSVAIAILCIAFAGGIRTYLKGTESLTPTTTIDTSWIKRFFSANKLINKRYIPAPARVPVEVVWPTGKVRVIYGHTGEPRNCVVSIDGGSAQNLDDDMKIGIAHKVKFVCQEADEIEEAIYKKD